MMTRKDSNVFPITAGVFGSLALAVSASGQFINATIEEFVLGAPEGFVTYRVVAHFEGPDLMLAWGAIPGVAELHFFTGNKVNLLNGDGDLDGLKFGDFAGFSNVEYDSWLTVGATGLPNDTDYDPRFAGSDGTLALLTNRTNSFDDTDGVVYNSNPKNPWFGPDVVMAQFTIPEGNGFHLEGMVGWALPGAGFESTPFSVDNIGGGDELLWFGNQAAFEAFNVAEGNVLKGIEDFEESILGSNDIVNLDDPLESGVPNSPDGFPFPDGMTGLPNLIVQSNILGGNPIVPDPQGVGGLAAVSAVAFGVVSDVVVPGSIPSGIDLIFTDEKSGVGFNTISLLAGTSVELRVYSPENVFLGMVTTPANPSGTNFIGVWSPDPIARVNIFDPSSKPEGADNIQAWEAGSPCPWDLDANGNVGASDLLALLASWGPCKGCPADFDDNGNVGASDLLALLANWGPCP